MGKLNISSMSDGQKFEKEERGDDNMEQKQMEEELKGKTNEKQTWVIPCQINTKKSLPSPISTKLGFYTVSVEILTHSEFQHSAMYGFRVRTRRKIDFSEIFSLPIVTKLTITLTEINFRTYRLHHL